MQLSDRIKSFVKLGDFLNQFVKDQRVDELAILNENHYDEFAVLINKQKQLNGWFTKDNVILAIDGVVQMLKEDDLNKWLENYDQNQLNEKEVNSIGVIMAGNIPLVGFHDFLTVLISGNRIQVKMSSSDNTLLKKVGEVLIDINPDWSAYIQFITKLENFNAVIATGSDNSSRYFEHYFGKYPHIIRKNRTSVGIVHSNDNKSDLVELGKDVFQYFGLGCRNVSKIYFPKAYNMDEFFGAIYEDHQGVIDNNKYANNYDYNKAVYLMGQHDLLDNGFVLLKESEDLNSPVGVLHYEFYDSFDQLEKDLTTNANNIQCVVSSKNTPIDTLEFGEAQKPKVWDYADGVDTMDFLLKLHR